MNALSVSTLLRTSQAYTTRLRMTMMMVLLTAFLTTCVTHSFQLSSPIAPTRSTVIRLYETSASSSDLVLSVQEYLKENHSVFFDLVLSKNDQAWKKLSEASTVTIFAVTDEGMLENIGEKKLAQLKDIRNEETVLRMAEYHTIADDAVSAAALFDSGGIVTIAQDVIPVERTKTGGFLFMGGTEDGGVTVGGAKVVSTLALANGNAMIHAMDNVVSPSILWRYCDQLRIPGSK